MGAIIAKEPTNTGRQLELDIARGLAVFFMIAIHSMQVFAAESVKDTTLGFIIDFVGGAPAAPVFMFLLGIGVVYTKKADPAIFYRRGLLLILGGYILNLLRGTLPHLIRWWNSGNQEFLQKSFQEFVSIDILQFAGLAMIFFGLIKQFKPSILKVMAIGTILAMLNFALQDIKLSNPVAAAIGGLFWGTGKISYFPFLTWILYPIVGYLFGLLLIRCANKLRFYAINLASGIVVMVLSTYLFIYLMGIDIGIYEEYAYYHHNLLGNITFIAFTVSWISVLFFISKWIKGILYSTIVRWSKNVTEIYFVQWILIGWGTLIPSFNTLNTASYVGIFLLLVIASDLLAYIYLRSFRK